MIQIQVNSGHALNAVDELTGCMSVADWSIEYRYASKLHAAGNMSAPSPSGGVPRILSLLTVNATGIRKSTTDGASNKDGPGKPQQQSQSITSHTSHLAPQRSQFPATTGTSDSSPDF